MNTRYECIGADSLSGSYRISDTSGSFMSDKLMFFEKIKAKNRTLARAEQPERLKRLDSQVSLTRCHTSPAKSRIITAKKSNVQSH